MLHTGIPTVCRRPPAAYYRNLTELGNQVLLVTFAPDAGWSGWALVTSGADLLAYFGCKVDLVERAAVEQSETCIQFAAPKLSR